MVIIITGEIGVGKTTICQKLVKIARSQGYSCGGIVTYKAGDGNIIIEDIRSGKKATLASSSTVYDGPHTPRYSFIPEGIDFGMQAIDRGSSEDILIVDEIGHLELRGEGFFMVPELIREGQVNDCVLVLRQNLLSSYLPKLDVVMPLILEATVDNRDRLPEEILKVFNEKLRQKT